jgi:DMSO/TMAO reductase YedYZ molybdopterin-dependent catalytic subunit
LREKNIGTIFATQYNRGELEFLTVSKGVTGSSSAVNLETPIRALAYETTPTDSFYIRSHFPAPKIDSINWRLRLECEPKDRWLFTLDDLTRMPQSTVIATLECAGNSRSLFNEEAEGEIQWGEGALGTADWTGVSLSHLVRNECGLSKELRSWKAVIFEGADGSKTQRFVRYLSAEKALEKDVFVALYMNGKPLPEDHGYPARLIVPGWYGMASVKWLSKITFSPNSPHTFFNDVKYVYKWKDKARVEPTKEMRVKSLVTNPSNGQQVRLGEPTVISGKAWSGYGKIVRVEIGETLDENSWADVELGEHTGNYSWVSWKKDWTPRRKGSVVLVIRATDSKGNTQPLQPERNEYLYGYNAATKISLNVV